MTTTLPFMAVWAWMLFDVYRTDRRFVRQGPKWCWMTFVLTLPVLGAVAWMIFGRPFIAVRKDRVRLAAIGPEDTQEWSTFLHPGN